MSYAIRVDKNFTRTQIFQFFRIATLRVAAKHFRMKGFFEVTFAQLKSSRRKRESCGNDNAAEEFARIVKLMADVHCSAFTTHSRIILSNFPPRVNDETVFLVNAILSFIQKFSGNRN